MFPFSDTPELKNNAQLIHLLKECVIDDWLSIGNHVKHKTINDVCPDFELYSKHKQRKNNLSSIAPAILSDFLFTIWV